MVGAVSPNDMICRVGRKKRTEVLGRVVGEGSLVAGGGGGHTSRDLKKARTRPSSRLGEGYLRHKAGCPGVEAV